jgi:hypothetical protein
MNKFTQRYGDRTSARQCSTEGCHRTARSINGRCHTCIGRLRRFGHVGQTLPLQMELDGYIRRAEMARGRISKLDLDALKDRWEQVVSDCRAVATPTYKRSGKLSHNKWASAAAGLVRDIGESLDFLRALDLMTACALMNLEGRFRSLEAVSCSTVELFRRAAGVARFITDMRQDNGSIARSFRKEVGKEVRLAAYSYLMQGLGLPAEALANREHKRAEQERTTRTNYHAAVSAIAAK